MQSEDECDPLKNAISQCRKVFNSQECDDKELACLNDELLMKKSDPLEKASSDKSVTAVGELFHYYTCACRQEKEGFTKTTLRSNGNLINSFPQNVIIPITRVGFSSLKERVGTNPPNIEQVLSQLSLDYLEPNFLTQMESIIERAHKHQDKIKDGSIRVRAAADPARATISDPEGFKQTGIAQFSFSLSKDFKKQKSIPDFHSTSEEMMEKIKSEFKNKPGELSNADLAYGRGYITYLIIQKIIDKKYPNSEVKKKFSPIPVIEIEKPQRYLQVAVHNQNEIYETNALEKLSPSHFPEAQRPEKFRGQERAEEIHIIFLDESTPTPEIDSQKNYFETMGYYFDRELMIKANHYEYLNFSSLVGGSRPLSYREFVSAFDNLLKSNNTKFKKILGKNLGEVMEQIPKFIDLVSSPYFFDSGIKKAQEMALTRFEEDLKDYSRSGLNKKHVIAVAHLPSFEIPQRREGKKYMPILPQKYLNFFEQKNHNFYYIELLDRNSVDVKDTLKKVISSNASFQAQKIYNEGEKQIKNFAELKKIMIYIDDSGSVKAKEYSQVLNDFVKKIKTDFPGTEVFCLTGEKLSDERWVSWPAYQAEEVAIKDCKL